MAMKIEAKFEGKLTCVFKNDKRNLANFQRLQRSDCILQCNGRTKSKSKFETTRSTRSSEKTLFYLGNK